VPLPTGYDAALLFVSNGPIDIVIAVSLN